MRVRHGIAVIAQVQPIAVLFNLPEDDLGRYFKTSIRRKLKADAYDRDDMMKIASGTLLTADNQSTRAPARRASRPYSTMRTTRCFEQFVNVHLLLDVVKDATVITAAAFSADRKARTSMWWTPTRKHAVARSR
jgi:multidrug efflux system membrane fusion protein